VLPLGFASFFCFGLVLVLLGASQAGLERDLGLDLTQTGMLAAMLAFGLLVGVVGAGPLFDRFSRRPLFVAAASLAGLALLAIGPSSTFGETCALVALVGIGTGAYDTLFNASIVERFGERSARPMSILHSATTVGAVLCPLLAALVATRWHWTRGFHAVGIAHLLVAAAALGVDFPKPRPTRPTAGERFFSIRLLPFAFIAFAYVGIEGSLTVFAVPYADDGLGLSAARGQAAISAFWFGLLVGRLGPLLLPTPLDRRALVAAGAAGALAIAAGVGFDLREIEWLFAVFGMTTGCVYPVMIALAAQQFPNARGSAAGLTAGAGAIGGFAIPWSTGAIGDGFGIAAAIATLSLWCVAISIGGFGAGRLGAPVERMRPGADAGSRA